MVENMNSGDKPGVKEEKSVLKNIYGHRMIYKEEDTRYIILEFVIFY